MKFNLIVNFFICLIISLFPFNSYAFLRNTKVTLVVMDEENVLLVNFDAGVSFEINTGWGTDVIPQDGFTDGEGKATFSGQSNGHIAYGTENDGYYPSYYSYDFKKAGALGWEPWNPELKIVMRKLENPVPMYARHAGMKQEIRVPELNKDIGFDLVVCDWVAPFGEGKIADFVFNLEKNFINTKDYWAVLNLKFSNNNDGIINVKENFKDGSVFKLPRFAPDYGYQNAIKFSRSRSGTNRKKTYSTEDNYIFRIRSKEVDGEIFGLYGKIQGEIEIGSLRDLNPKINFKYFLNPDGTKNLEFDSSQNLFKNLPMLEQVKVP